MYPDRWYINSGTSLVTGYESLIASLNLRDPVSQPSCQNQQRLFSLGVIVHDACLVAAMKAYRIPRIVTFNYADFHHFTEIETIHPAKVEG